MLSAEWKQADIQALKESCDQEAPLEMWVNKDWMLVAKAEG